MTLRKQIEKKIRTIFNPVLLEVVDESYQHNVSITAESHFKVLLVSNHFAGTSLLNRHRMIYSVLSEELSCTLHAIALHIYTIQEWRNLRDTRFPSPPCRGGETRVSRRFRQ